MKQRRCPSIDGVPHTTVMIGKRLDKISFFPPQIPESARFIRYNHSRGLSRYSPYGHVRHFSCHSVFAIRCLVANGRFDCVFRLSMSVAKETDSAPHANAQAGNADTENGRARSVCSVSSHHAGTIYVIDSTCATYSNTGKPKRVVADRISVRYYGFIDHRRIES